MIRFTFEFETLEEALLLNDLAMYAMVKLVPMPAPEGAGFSLDTPYAMRKMAEKERSVGAVPMDVKIRLGKQMERFLDEVLAMTRFQDLYNLPEDERIKLIAHYVVEHRLTVAVFVDDEPGKPERYKQKLEAEGCVIVGREQGPVPNVVTLKVAPGPITAASTN